MAQAAPLGGLGKEAAPWEERWLGRQAVLGSRLGWATHKLHHHTSSLISASRAKKYSVQNVEMERDHLSSAIVKCAYRFPPPPLIFLRMAMRKLKKSMQSEENFYKNNEAWKLMGNLLFSDYTLNPKSSATSTFLKYPQCMTAWKITFSQPARIV